MTEPTYLNIDEIKPRVLKRIRLNGKDHDMVPPSVETFIADVQDLEKTRKTYGEDVPMHVAIESVVRFVHSVFPTTTLKELNKLTFEQLDAIRKLVQADIAPPDEVKEAEGNG